MLRRDPLANLEPLIKRVYAYVAYRVGDNADAEDITSSTFERALRYRASFDEKKGDAIGWLIGIARREIGVHFAAQPTTPDVPDLAAPGDLAVDTATRLDLHSAVAGLDERDRDLLALRYGADLSAKQIAELLDQKTNAVEVALHRALRRLRDRMTGAAASEPGPEPGPEPRRVTRELPL